MFQELQVVVTDSMIHMQAMVSINANTDKLTLFAHVVESFLAWQNSLALG